MAQTVQRNQRQVQLARSLTEALGDAVGVDWLASLIGEQIGIGFVGHARKVDDLTTALHSVPRPALVCTRLDARSQIPLLSRHLREAACRGVKCLAEK